MNKYLLILGDILAILVVTIVGFATHGETDISFLPRMAAMFSPLVIAWFILSPFLGLFEPEITSDAKQLWKPVLAMIFAAPLAAVLRGLLLKAPIIPVFAVVLAASSAFGMLLWRGFHLLLKRR
jgi:hypothetical protein